jgi:hypothetical protein
MLGKRAGIEITHVPYRGAEALNDLLAGRIQFMFATIPSVIQHIQAGKLRAIAVTSVKRSRSMPDVPTVAERGYPGFEAGSWFGVFAPKGTPEPVITALNKAVNDALPSLEQQMIREGADPVGGSPAQFGQFLQKEFEKWKVMVQGIGRDGRMTGHAAAHPAVAAAAQARPAHLAGARRPRARAGLARTPAAMPTSPSSRATSPASRPSTRCCPTRSAFYDALRAAPSLRWVHAHSAGADRPVFLRAARARCAGDDLVGRQCARGRADRAGRRADAGALFSATARGATARPGRHSWAVFCRAIWPARRR